MTRQSSSNDQGVAGLLDTNNVACPAFSRALQPCTAVGCCHRCHAEVAKTPPAHPSYDAQPRGGVNYMAQQQLLSPSGFSLLSHLSSLTAMRSVFALGNVPGLGVGCCHGCWQPSFGHSSTSVSSTTPMVPGDMSRGLHAMSPTLTAKDTTQETSKANTTCKRRLQRPPFPDGARCARQA